MAENHHFRIAIVPRMWRMEELHERPLGGWKLKDKFALGSTGGALELHLLTMDWTDKRGGEKERRWRIQIYMQMR